MLNRRFIVRATFPDAYPIRKRKNSMNKRGNSSRTVKTLAAPRLVTTDRGLECLKGLAQLKSLDLAECKNLTDEGVQRLQDAVAHCKITREHAFF